MNLKETLIRNLAIRLGVKILRQRAIAKRKAAAKRGVRTRVTTRGTK